jgi:methionyl-tRNA synthetase
MQNPKRYTVTAALPYVNGYKHIGHLAGAYLPADIYVRYLRSKKEDVLFVCGSDELGTAITMQAHKENMTPKQLVDKYHKISKDSFEKLGIDFDIYHRTSESLHFETAQEFFLELYNKGLFEEKTTEQYYDEELNQFLADRYIKGICPNCSSDKAFGDQCESCGKSLDPTDLIHPISVVTGNKPVLKQTKNLYLSLDKYEGFLREWLLEGKKGKWKSNTYGQSKSWIDGGLNPRSMTRDGEWGVPVPLEAYKDKILYVWFDAPIGYISATKQWAIDNKKDWAPYWKDKDTKLVHFVGKDNIVFHCIIFPIMLEMHGDFILPEDVPANEFLNLEGEKMSTSRNWSLEMYEYLEDFSEKIDELRYCLVSNMPENKDSDFSWKDYQLKNNSELVSIAGNLVNRVFVLTHKFFEGKVPQSKGCSELETFIREQKEKVSKAIENYSFREALFETMQVARHGNKLLTEKEPWKLIKTDEAAAGVVLYDCFQIIANWAIMIEPFLPNASKVLKEKLNIAADLNWEHIGSQELVPSQTQIAPSFYLFTPIEDEVIAVQIEKLKAKTIKVEEPKKEETPNEIAPLKPEITFDDFAKLDLVMGTILEAEKVAKSDKLLKFQVDLGFEVRTIVSGVALHFAPEALVGKQVMVVANLAPRKIMGVESRGMILFADNDGKLIRMSGDEEVSNGSRVS